MDRISEYAILRLVPEAFRGEQINIGLIVLDGPRLDVRILAQPAVFKVLGVDPARLDWIVPYLRDQDRPDLQSDDRWKRLEGIPGIAFSERGWISSETDDQYEDRLERIRADYIDRPKQLASRQRATNLVRDLRRVFSDYSIMGKHSEDVNRHKVVANVPVGPSGRLHVDFVIKNGVFHATETADFRAKNEVGVAQLKEAALASITLQCAKEQLGHGDTKCYLVYSAPSVIEAAISPALQLAERGVDRMFNVESGDQRRDYFDLMLAAAGSPTMFDRN